LGRIQIVIRFPNLFTLNLHKLSGDSINNDDGPLKFRHFAFPYPINIIKPSRKREKEKRKREIPQYHPTCLHLMQVFFEIELNACRFNHQKKSKLLANPLNHIL
jgi:hypothetical protein